MGNDFMLDIADAIKSVGEAFTSFFNLLQTNLEEQCEIQLVKDKKRLKKATNIAEEAFRLVDENKSFFPDDVAQKYEKLRKEFDKQD